MTLFHRSNKGVIPTDSGKKIIADGTVISRLIMQKTLWQFYRRGRFLGEMDAAVPWARLEGLIGAPLREARQGPFSDAAHGDVTDLLSAAMVQPIGGWRRMRRLFRGSLDN